MIHNTSGAQTPRRIVAADLVGAWSLKSYTDAAEDGALEYPLGKNPRGLLIYTLDGLMSAQLMSAAHTPPRAAVEVTSQTTGEEPDTAGFIGYCGEYQFDEAESIMYHLPTVSFDRSFIGERLRREVEMDGDLLSLTLVSAGLRGIPVKSTLCWLRMHAHRVETPKVPPVLG